jgi:energy-coupling factor transport system ATP-binding protein
MNREVIFFDEPGAGLDGEARNKIMELMRSLADQGKTVLFTTHHQDEADFADREIKIENGLIVKDTLTYAAEGGEGPVLSTYSSTAILTGLKDVSQKLSGSGWKNKCPLEKIPAAGRLLLFLIIFTLCLVFRSIVSCSIMLALAFVYCLFAKFHPGRMLKSLLKILPFLCFFAIFQIMFRPALAGEIQYTSWRFFTVTPSKLWFCLNSMLRTYAALLSISAFFISTTEYDLIDGLKKIIPSRNLILILEVIFRFIPLLVDEATDIIKTQIIRGGLGKVKGKLAKIKALVPLIVPLVIRTIRRSEKLADAIVMRCFHDK